MTYFLLTRPIKDSQKMQTELENLGIKSIIDPLLDIKKLDISINFKPYKSIIITSPKAIDSLPDDPSMPLWCVGKSTAEKCQKAGFEYIIYKQTVEELIEEILTQPTEEIGHCLYLRGKTVTTDLKGMLEILGYTIDEAQCYDAVPNNTFKTDTLKAFHENKIEYTALFSLQSTFNFIDIIHTQKLENHLKKVICFAYSTEIEDALSDLPFLKLICCPQPCMDSFWKELKNCVSCNK